MIARGAHGIRHSATYLRDTMIPATDDPAAANDLRLLAQHFDIIAEDFDRVVDNLVRDRVELEHFFRAALPHLDEDDAALVAAALADTVPGYRTAELIARGDRDMTAFITVHASVDRAVGQCWAEPLHAAAWRFLDAYLERRRYHAVG